MIILEPIGGLANRMRVIASGIWLSNKLEKELIIIWNENYELNCPFNSLFIDYEIFIIEKKKRKHHYIQTSAQTTLAKTIRTTIVNKLIGIDYCIRESDFNDSVLNGKLDVYEVAKNNDNIYIQTCQEFGNNSFAFRYFKPIPLVAKKIDLITKDFTAFTIGVHIRRMDHSNSIKHSPLNLFIAKMKEELELQKLTTFFLCTDDREVEKTILAIFGNRIIVYKKILSRQTVLGMQDAVIDLYCLSKTKKILGSYWSSYSDIASRLTNIKLEVVKV